MMESEIILELKNIIVKYGETHALNHFYLSLNKGEIHAVVGEHRAGKSSIAKLLGGLIRKQSGTIRIYNQMIDYFSPTSSIKNRIGIIYQDTNLIPSLNAVENIFAGRFQLGFFRTISLNRMTEQVEIFLKKWKFTIDLRTPVGRLPRADQHKIELIRAIYFDPDILIFDEISNKLNADEIDIAYQLILNLKQKGKSILYISNNMNEIFEFSDRVSILKNGSVVSTQDIKAIDKVRLIDLTYSFASTREELRKRNVELYNFKKYNEDIINSLPLGVIIFDRDKKIYLINYSATEILSFDMKNKNNQLEDILSLFSFKLSNAIKYQIDERKTSTWEEIEYKKNQFLNITIFPFKDEDYVFLGTILLIQDISREYYLNNYLLQTERISSIAELAAGVAHEVNNPLGIILNYVELLERHHSDNYSLEKINLIKDELNRIQSIIGSLLSFSHLKETPMTSLNIISLIDETLLLINYQFKEKGITIFWDPPHDAVNIIGNKNRLKQMVINLIRNSVEAVKIKGKIIISVKSFSNEGFSELCFSDNGRGIPENDINLIFNPFFTTKTAGENAGLGLSICQHIVEAHQGIISCKSNNEKTSFYVRLPLVK